MAQIIDLLKEALIEPVKITVVVFVAGLLFRRFKKPIGDNVNKAVDAVGVKAFAFLVIVLLGFLSSIITAIVTALILVEIIAHIRLDRESEIRLVILACFSIGLGAALTPIGEPLSTIAIAKLKGEPYQAGFFFLLVHLWQYIIPGILLFGTYGAILMPAKRRDRNALTADGAESLKEITVRSIKIYFFIMALVILGNIFKPLIDSYVSRISYRGLYWFNLISAVLDNATLATAEIGPRMGILQIKASLLGLLIAGGMLIPGNIPNIIAAGKLKIKNSEWARFAVPFGLIIMVVTFFCF